MEHPEQQQQEHNEEQGQQKQLLLSLSALENACQYIMDHNFDCDTKVCFTTLMKMIDNIIHHPCNLKYRSINIINPAFQKKVGNVKGSIDFLLSCGFTYSNNNNNNNRIQMNSISISSSSLLILVEQNENQKHLIHARRLITMRCIQDLHCTVEELPIYKPPPAPVVLISSSDQQQQQAQQTAISLNQNPTSTSNFVFNPYVGQRYDGSSVETGISTGPSPDYISKTETELKKLHDKQKQLIEQSAEFSSNITKKRHWVAYQPNETVVVATNSNNEMIDPRTKAIASKIASTSSLMNNNTDNTNKHDNSMLMEKLQKQNEEKKQNLAGFTTKAMRDLSKMKKMKIYQYVTLTIQFPDGYKLASSSFIPNDTIDNVICSIYNDCFDLTKSLSSLTNNTDLFDLYVTPPRRLLKSTQTLLEQDLVPAAKIFISWKKNWYDIIKSSNRIIQQDLFVKGSGGGGGIATTTNNGVSFPSGKSLIGDDKNDNEVSKDDTKDKKLEKKNSTGKKKMTREELLLQRMMGGK